MIFDLSDRTQLELTGTDRAKFLHGFCTNDIKALSPGRGCEAFVCNVHGKVLGHIFVFCTETSLWIDTVPGQEVSLFGHFDRYLINEDVQIQRRSAEYGDLYLHQTLPSDDFPNLTGRGLDERIEAPVLSHATLGTWQVRQVDWLGEAGWLISAPRNELQLPASSLAISNSETWNALRIAAGFPLYGVDITSDNLAQEANRTERCISFKKGCYLGQEPIARIDALGHVNKELRRLTLMGDSVPVAGSPLLDAAAGSQIGVITSAAQLSGSAAALGYLRTKLAVPGLQVFTADGMVGTVV